jgi:hypothetical protein
MEILDDFFKGLLNIIKVDDQGQQLSLPQQRQVISKINEFLYTNYPGIGTTIALDEEFEYFSEFHKYWDKCHRDILNPQIDEDQGTIVADILHDIYTTFGGSPFTELYDTAGLKPEEICKVRYFTATQDFRGSREFKNFAKIYKQDSSIFDSKIISDDPGQFLKDLGLTNLSQSDKRVKYAKTSADILVNNGLEPFDLLMHCHDNFRELREFLVDNVGSGWGKKKADMFLRDMKILDVWPNGTEFGAIDVASDINTIRVALRSGILKTDILLLSSFLDIFCYQYGLMDEMNSKAWRRVWEIWHKKYPSETIESPCLMDYLIYRFIGKELCKDTLVKFRCEEKNHEFFWHSGRNRTCQVCYKEERVKRRAVAIMKDLPCKYPEGEICLQNMKKNDVLPGIKECPFIPACNPRSITFRKLNPPKSISILGATGWDTARTRKDEGGGGLMA